MSSVCDVIFEDNVIKSCSVPPLIEYNIMGLKEVVRRPMDEAVCSMVWGISQKGANKAL